MMDKPLVSVVVPIFNAEKYLDRCIISILNQFYTGFELLLIDDGSTDASCEICNFFVKQDKRVSFYKKANGGVSDARNYGIQRASSNSTFICFIDSDDLVSPYYLEYLVSAIDDAQLSMCHIKDVHDSIQIGEKVEQIEIINYNNIRNNSAFVERFMSGILNSPCNKLYRLDIIRNHGISFPLDAVIAEDLIFNLGYLRCTSMVNEIMNSLYFYCHHDGSLVSIVKPEAYDSYIVIRDNMIDFWGIEFESLIDSMIYRQFESISIKLIKQMRGDEVKKFAAQPVFKRVVSHIHLTNWNERLIKFLLYHNKIKLLEWLIVITSSKSIEGV